MIIIIILFFYVRAKKSHQRGVPNDLTDVRSKNLTNAGPERPFRCLDRLLEMHMIVEYCIELYGIVLYCYLQAVFCYGIPLLHSIGQY